MSRGRMLNKSVSASVKIHNLSDDTCRLLATWIIPHLDMRGVFYGDAAMVKSTIFPRRADVTIEQVEGYLQELCDAGLLEIFEANGDVWQYWPGFSHNQIGLRADRESSQFPKPPGYIETEDQANDGRLPEDSRNDDGNLPAEDKENVNVNLSETEEDIPATPDPSPPPAPKPTKNPKTTPLTDLAREFLRLFSAKRFANSAQRSAVLELERQFPANFLAAATWAAEKGVARGQAIGMIRKALPGWGDKPVSRPYNPSGGKSTVTVKPSVTDDIDPETQKQQRAALRELRERQGGRDAKT